jgi:type III pantothenate kinase
MQLVIDIGNTRLKAALFEQNNLEHYFVFNSSTEFFEANLFERYSIQHCIVSSVINEIEPFVNIIKEKIDVLSFSSNTPTPIKNLYKTAHTLGSDRLAAAVGANLLFPNKNILVIDAGTCIKYNFVNSNNEYIGGAISPGLQMRFKALNTFTARLPLLEIDNDFDTLVGTNSNESVLSGVEIGVVAEVEGIMERYKNTYSDITIIITGGDVNFFEKQLKNSIFADPFLILKGLNRILDHNINKI